MKISRISAYQVDLPRDRVYKLSSGQTTSTFDTTVVRVETDEGIVGLGEICPFGRVYLPAYAEGARTGLREIAPLLIGQDPCTLDAVNEVMDRSLKGHPYVKSALDIACWDILGQATGLPVSTLLGGRFGETVKLYQSISHDTPEAMVASLIEARGEGFRRFQPKIGGEPDLDISRVHAMAAERAPGEVVVFDANGSWLPHEAARVIEACRGLDIYFEQPCATYEECLTIRQRMTTPLVLDEVIDSIPALLRAIGDGAMDAVNLKLSKVGGLTKARRFRDICVAMGLAMTLEDSGGGAIIAAAIAHLGHSTPERYRFGSASGFFKMKVALADGAPTIENGTIRASTRPGLGLTPRPEAWGEAFLDTAALREGKAIAAAVG